MSRARIDFAGVVAETRSTGFTYEYTHPSILGSRPVKWNFRDSAPDGLAKEFARRVGPIAPDLFREMATQTFEGYRESYRELGRLILGQPGREFRSLRDITPEDIDALDRPGNHSRYRCLRTLLQGFFREDPECLEEHTAARVFQVSEHSKATTPREPLSDYVIGQIKEKADKEIAQIRKRIYAGREYVSKLEAKADLTEAERIELKIIRGIKLTTRDAHVRKFLDEKTTAQELKSMVNLSPSDGIAFLLAIATRENLPIESAKALRFDCLQEARGGRAKLKYYKGRDKTKSEKSEQISDGGSSTTGGIIRIAQDLTSYTRSILESAGSEDASYLLIGSSLTGAKSNLAFKFDTNTITKVVLSWGITGDDGKPLTHFQSSRLRKSAKRDEYKAAKGSLRNFARGHSRGVAGDHYARIGALEEEHRQAVEAAQADLLNSAMVPNVVSVEAEQSLTSGATIEVSGSEYVIDESSIDESNDTILGVCLDFWNSPMDRDEDGGCGSGFMVCLHCRNAVFHRRKLPAILAYFSYIQDKITVMSFGDWLKRYGRHWARIKLQILPDFTQDDIAWALSAVLLTPRELSILEGTH